MHARAQLTFSVLVESKLPCPRTMPPTVGRVSYFICCNQDNIPQICPVDPPMVCQALYATCSELQPTEWWPHLG